MFGSGCINVISYKDKKGHIKVEEVLTKYFVNEDDPIEVFNFVYSVFIKGNKVTDFKELIGFECIENEEQIRSNMV